MDVLFYPYLYVRSESKLKRLLLSWERVFTLAPTTMHEDFREVGPQKMYDRLNQLAQQQVVDLLPVDWEEKYAASERMFDAICAWRDNPTLYRDLQLARFDRRHEPRISNLGGLWAPSRIFRLHIEKATPALIDILQEERLAIVNGPDEILGTNRVGHMYMSLLAQEVRQRRSMHIMSDDTTSAALSSLSSAARGLPPQGLDALHLATVAVPDVYIPDEFIERLSIAEVVHLRKELLPLAQAYHDELNGYQTRICNFSLQGDDNAAIEQLVELAHRAHVSFQPFAREWSRLLRFATPPNLAWLQVVCRIGKILSGVREIDDVFDIASLAGSFLDPQKLRRSTGLDYLMALNRRVHRLRARHYVTDLIPKMPGI